MAGNESLASQKPVPELWPGSGIPQPAWWNPDGLLGGVKDMYPPASGLDLLMTPEQMADAGITPTGADGKASGLGDPNPGNAPGDSMDGIRPSGWDAANGDRGGRAPVTIDQVDPEHLAPGRPEGLYLGDYLPHGIRTPIGPVPGYPETGRGVWRAELDDQITQQAGDFNTRHGYQPGDPLYVTPQLVKSWAMQESGGHRSVFETDPMQINTPGNWSSDKADLGLTRGQKPTPLESIGAGLEWLNKKATRPNADGTPQTMRDALTTYRWGNPNGGNHVYADLILGRISGSGKSGGR